MNFLKGHALIREGTVAYDSLGHAVPSWPDGDTQLHAKCQCGALSEPGVSRSAAQRWHREHKQQVREAGATT